MDNMEQRRVESLTPAWDDERWRWGGGQATASTPSQPGGTVPIVPPFPGMWTSVSETGTIFTSYLPCS